MAVFAAVFFHLPLAVGSLDAVVVLKGNIGVAEDLGVVDGIYTSQAAWPHAPHFPESRTDTRNAERYPNDAYDQADLLQDPAVNTRLEIKRDTVLRC